MEKIAFLIPCHNEKNCILAVLEKLIQIFPVATCVVINDGSDDDTAKTVYQYAKKHSNVVLLDLAINLGIGGAMQTGFLYTAERDFDYVVKVDGDGQHPAEEIAHLLKKLQDGSADMVIGSRFLTKEGFQSTAMRRIGIRFFQYLTSLLVRKHITDCTSGFRAYNRDAFVFASRHYPAFDYPEPEEVILMAKNRFRILEVPVAMEARQTGVSSINLKRSIYYMCKVSFAMLMAALRSAERKEEKM